MRVNRLTYLEIPRLASGFINSRASGIAQGWSPRLQVNPSSGKISESLDI